MPIGKDRQMQRVIRYIATLCQGEMSDGSFLRAFHHKVSFFHFRGTRKRTCCYVHRRDVVTAVGGLAGGSTEIPVCPSALHVVRRRFGSESRGSEHEEDRSECATQEKKPKSHFSL